MIMKSFPVSNKEYKSVLKAIPTGISLLIKSYLGCQRVQTDKPCLMINGSNIFSSKIENLIVSKDVINI